MSAHLDNEERVKELIKDSFEKNTVEFPIFLDKLIGNELADSQISEQRLISDIEQSLGNQKSKINTTETIETNSKLISQRSRSRSGSRSRSRSGLSRKSSSIEPSSASENISPSSSHDVSETFQTSSKLLSPSMSSESTASESLSKSSMDPSLITMKIERKLSGTAMSMDEIAKILNQREATRKPDSVQSTLETTEKVELEVTEKYQIKNPELNDLIQFDRTDLPEDVGLFLQSKIPDFDEAEMLTELQDGILKLAMK